MSDKKTFTGVRREKKTRWTVRLADVVSKSLITIGGIGTIGAVSLVFLFLGYVALPMFRSAETSGETSTKLAWGDEKLLRLSVDEYRILGWALSESGSLIVFRADTGEIILRKPLFPDAKLTAVAFHCDSPSVSFGFADGTVRIGKIDFTSGLLDLAKLTPEVRTLVDDLPADGVTPFAGGIVQRMPQGEFRQQKLDVEFNEPIKLAATPIKLVDHFLDDKRTVITALSADNKVVHSLVRRIEAVDGTVRLKPGKKTELPYEPRSSEPFKLLLTGLGDGVLFAWRDGHAARFDCRAGNEPTLAEQVDLVSDHGAILTACELLLGRTTVIAGDSTGQLSAWFPIRPKSGATTVDGQQLVLGHKLPGGKAAVTSLEMSSRGRLCFAGFADGSLKLVKVTNEKLLVDTTVGSGDPVMRAAVAPKEDSLYAATPHGLWSCALDPAYPDISLKGLFRPVWYEQYPEPTHAWQSGGGSADVEPKLGLVPLIFGTLKATLYSMLFGAPLALLAAVYTSEFLQPRIKARVKPTIELMASLPSVVLGFLAGLVIAQFVEKHVPEVLTTFITIPFMVLLGAHLWQILSQRTAILYAWVRLPAVLLLGIIGLGLGALLGPLAERVLFAGDLMKWLDGQKGTGAGAWFMLLLPTGALVSALFIGKFVNPVVRQRFADVTRRRFAVLNLVKFLAATACTLVVAYLLSLFFNWALFDPRGAEIHDFMGTYVQRNALVVGFIMGFAIIPIIYTIAEDALSTVPEHLRSASLGAGATPWQTAVRVVIPTAMSGLFSAVMIGLGRAVGETMIVLMAAGNTAVMEMNLFNGFRTLSANIATELPEAPRDGSLYRTLFLAALTLFVMTFIVNTVAEIVRLRFRRRAYQL